MTRVQLGAPRAEAEQRTEREEEPADSEHLRPTQLDDSAEHHLAQRRDDPELDHEIDRDAMLLQVDDEQPHQLDASPT